MTELEWLRREYERLKEENRQLRDTVWRLGGTAGDDANTAAEQPPVGPHAPGTYGTQSQQQKIELFYELFCGRTDVFAYRWESRSGKTGYSPAHYHDTDQSICRRPRKKCEELGPKRYVPFSHEVVRQHLTGRAVVGAYPLLTDDTCRYLAVDFDKAEWAKDARRFAERCGEHGLPAYIERSRSGSGGHVWLFFDEPVPAALARELGLGLLATASLERYPVSFDSFDRLFPNQDTLPKLGFGNLIALPLQWNARKENNSVFMDRDGKAWDDQWTGLAGVQRISHREIETTLMKLRIPLDRLFREPGLPDTNQKHEDADRLAPWERSPSGVETVASDVIARCPATVNAVRANMFFVEKRNLPAQLLNRVLATAAFGNPEFYKAQKMRMPVRDKPRVISCAEDEVEYVGLPRGCEAEAVELLSNYGVSVETTERRYDGVELGAEFIGTLEDRQDRVLTALLETEIGVLCAPTAFGKTIVAIAAIAARGRNALVLVHRRRLAEQWAERLREFLDLPADAVGVLGPNGTKATGQIDIGLFQSLFRNGTVNDIVANYGHVVVDECHHVSAFSFEQVMRQVHARYVLGLTATPVRQDGHHPIVHMQCGPIRQRISEKEDTKAHAFTHTVIVRETELMIENVAEKPIYEIYDTLVENEDRNALVVNDLLSCCRAGRLPLLLSERKRHLEILRERVEDEVDHCFVLTGGMGKKRTRDAVTRLSALEPGESAVLLATGKFVGEGFDHASLDTLFLAFPVSWKGIVQQYVGRIHRRHADKHEVRVYDYADKRVAPLAASFRRRVKSYKSMGYRITNSTG